ANAMLDSDQNEKALTRFRIPWQWQGQEAVLQSRATDDKGNVQPSRQARREENGSLNFYHYNGIQSWAVASDGAVRNTYV
ncbi:MAG: sulfite dehydrogenase, partial [Gammaproteobacteria bacterium]|nr:sulfite dehydrogenase [Gammaproteobacteria bacterium]